MPIYEFQCPDGHKHKDMFAWDKRPDVKPCIKCGRPARHVQSQVQRAALAPHFSREAEDINARNRAYLESDAGKEALKNGELVPEANAKSDESVVEAMESQDIYSGSDLNTGLERHMQTLEEADIDCEKRWDEYKKLGSAMENVPDDGLGGTGLGGDAIAFELDGV